MEENENESIDMQKRQEALQKFREDLSRPLTERFYSEDELIDLFDFASDYNDDYLRMEVLLCAARFYPTSEELLQRKAIFYSQYSDEVRDKCLDDNKKSSGMIWDVMRAYALKDQDSDTKRECLHNIIEEAGDISDEEIIQFVDLVYTFGEYEWLKDNIDWIGEKVVFRSVLLFEVGMLADNVGDTEYSIKVMEELTELEPYNPDFWMVLSRNYLKNSNFDKAISCLDYNIALNPKSVMPQVMKGKLLYLMHQDQQEVLDVVKEVKNAGIENCDVIRMEAAIYAERGDLQKILDTYTEYLSTHEEDISELLPDLVDFIVEDLDGVLDRIYSCKQNPTAEEWLEWARQLHHRGLPAKASAVIKAYYRNTPQEKPSLMVLDETLRMGLFNTVFDLVEILKMKELEESKSEDLDIDNVIEDWFNIPSPTIEKWRIDIVTMITTIKLGLYENARLLAKDLKKFLSVQSWMKPSDAFQVLGMISLVKDASKLLKTAEDTNLCESYDPFDYWQQEDEEKNAAGEFDDFFENPFDDSFPDDFFQE